MKKLFKIGIAFIFVAVAACNSNKNTSPNITGHYESLIDGDNVNMTFLADSTFVQTIQNRELGEIQFSGRYKWSQDTLYLIDDCLIMYGKASFPNDMPSNVPEEEKNRILKLVNYDEKNLVLRDLRTQRIWEYRRKD